MLLREPLLPYRPLRLPLIEDTDQRRLFRQYLERLHYLGYRAPYGAQLRSWVRAAPPDLPPLAALLFTSAAWRMAARDRYMWRSYLHVIREKCSQALHILYHFHIVAQINKALDEVRADEARQMAREGHEPLLKKTRWCVLKCKDNLTPQQRLPRAGSTQVEPHPALRSHMAVLVGRRAREPDAAWFCPLRHKIRRGSGRPLVVTRNSKLIRWQPYLGPQRDCNRSGGERQYLKTRLYFLKQTACGPRSPRVSGPNRASYLPGNCA